MSKQTFKDTLIHGKCRCGKAGQEYHPCPAGLINPNYAHEHNGKCNCCTACRDRCYQFNQIMDEAFEEHAKNMQREIDKEIIESLKDFVQDE